MVEPNWMFNCIHITNKQTIKGLTGSSTPLLAQTGGIAYSLIDSPFYSPCFLPCLGTHFYWLSLSIIRQKRILLGGFFKSALRGRNLRGRRHTMRYWGERRNLNKGNSSRNDNVAYWKWRGPDVHWLYFVTVLYSVYNSYFNFLDEETKIKSA